MSDGRSRNWQFLPFSDVIEDKTGGNKKIPQSQYSNEGLYPILDQGKNAPTGFTTSQDSLCKEELPVILFGDHTTEFKFVDFPFALGADGVKVLKPKKELDPKFAFHFLKQARFHKEDGYSRHFKFLKRLIVPLPPLPEQKRIAAILDKADVIRRKREKAIELTDSFLRSVFLEMFGDPELNPYKFDRGTIRDLVSEVKYGTSGKAGSEGSFEILRMNNLTYSGDIDLSDLKRIDIEPKDEPKYLVRKGDLLFNRTNSKELVGKTAVYPFEEIRAIAGYLIRVRPNEKANNEYIAGYLNSTHGKKTLRHMCKSIVGMANINAQELQDISILLPPLELQNRFADVVRKVRNFRRKLDRFLSEADLLKASLSSNLFANTPRTIRTAEVAIEVAHAL